MEHLQRYAWRIAVASILATHITNAQEQEIADTRLQARASSNGTTPSAINIAPSQYWDGNDGPWSSFPIQLGGGRSSVQNSRVFVSTAAYNIWTIGADGCPNGYNVPNCADKRGGVFLTNQSLTWVRNSIYSTSIEANLGLETTAPVGYETVTLGWQGSGGPSLEHRVVFNVYDPRYWLGVFGLNPQPTNFTNLNDPQPSFMKSLYDSGSIPSIAYGYTAGNQYRNNKVYGSLTLGGYDANRFSGGISWGMYADISRDLLVNIKSITTDSGSTTNLLPGGSISAYVDSTVSSLWLPTSACSAFESAFSITWNSTAGYYFLDYATHQRLVSTNPNVTISLTNGTQNVDIVLPYGAFDLNLTQPIVPSTQYYFPLQRAANDTQYTLGRMFLQEAYIIADYDRQNFTIAPCTWDQTKLSSTSIKSIFSPNLTAIAAQQQQNNNGSSISAGAIAGIVIGVVVLVVLAVGLFFFFRKRKTRQQRQLAELSEKGDGVTAVDAKVAPDDTAEAAGSELNELYAPHKPKAQEMESPYKMDPNKQGYFEMNGGDTHYAPGKGHLHEMDGARPVFEMQGSEVQEMPAREKPFYRTGTPKKK